MKRILFFASTIIYSSLFVSSCHKNENPVAATMPSITTQPISQTIAVGTAATFTVVASGAEPLNYQWFENGVAINNATLATYVTPTMNVGGSAAFTVTVSNSLGSDTSNIATLNVLTSGTLKVHSGKYWDWYADASTWAANVAAVTPIFPVMDTATDQLDRDWGTSSPTAKLYVYIDASLSGAAYSTGDISQVDDARGKSPSPGIGLAPGTFYRHELRRDRWYSYRLWRARNSQPANRERFSRRVARGLVGRQQEPLPRHDRSPSPEPNRL